MRHVYQTRFGSPDGNCFAACLASLLDTDLDRVPHFMHADGSGLDVPRLLQWCDSQGLFYAEFTFADKAAPVMPEGMLVVMCGRSPRGDWDHAIIARALAPQMLHKEGDTQLWGQSFDYVHDPNPHADGTWFGDNDPKAVGILLRKL